MTRLLVLAIVIGLVLPDVARFLRPLLYPSLFAIMLFTLIQIDISQIVKTFGRDTLRIVLLCGIQMVVLPVLLGLIFRSVSPDPMYAVPVILVTAAGGMFGTPSIAVLLGLPGRFTLFGVLVSTALLPFSLPLVWIAYSGEPLQMDVAVYGYRLILYIGVPALLAWIYRRLIRAGFNLPAAESMKVGAVTGLVIFAIAIMDGVTDRFLIDPALVIGLTLLAFVLHFGLFGLTWLLSRSFGRGVWMEAALLSAFRNIGLIIAISGPYLPQDFFLFAGVWQIPMYLSPWLIHRFLRYYVQHY
ncbi:MAG: hypothetical protein WBM41_17225 [Arenicellales bacterium]